MRFRPCVAVFLSSLAVSAIAQTASADDGTLEINQKCATQSGCFKGDAKGFPVTIDGSAGRSTVLTSDLEVPDSNTTAILVQATDVSVDLNGFSIRGTTTCSFAGGGPVTCQNVGIGNGVAEDLVFPSPRLERIEIHNGSIVGFGNKGVHLHFGTGALVRDLRVRNNGQGGIDVGNESVVQGNAVRLNGGAGIWAGLGSTILGNTSRWNFGSGIHAEGTSVIRNNAVLRNGFDGISTEVGSRVSDNTATGSARMGILVGHSSSVEGNSVSDNAAIGIEGGRGCTISGNSVGQSGEDGIFARESSAVRENSVWENGSGSSHDGIHCTLGCVVEGNAVRDSAGYGLRFNSTSTGYSGNTISSNTAGTVLLGTDAGGNVCTGALGCP